VGEARGGPGHQDVRGIEPDPVGNLDIWGWGVSAVAVLLALLFSLYKSS
jgi:hypothetical protein